MMSWGSGRSRIDRRVALATSLLQLNSSRSFPALPQVFAQSGQACGRGASPPHLVRYGQWCCHSQIRNLYETLPVEAACVGGHHQSSGSDRSHAFSSADGMHDRSRTEQRPLPLQGPRQPFMNHAKGSTSLSRLPRYNTTARSSSRTIPPIKESSGCSAMSTSVKSSMESNLNPPPGASTTRKREPRSSLRGVSISSRARSLCHVSCVSVAPSASRHRADRAATQRAFRFEPKA